MVLKRQIVMAAALLGLLLPVALQGVDLKKKPAPAPMQLTVGKVAWLAGSWRMEKNGRITEEQWMAPAGGGMLGMSRTTMRGRAVEHRFLQLKEGPGGSLFYIVQASGQKEAVLTMKSLTETVVEFENQQDDFPKTISYSLHPDGSMVTALEGQGSDGQPRRIENSFQRANR